MANTKISALPAAPSYSFTDVLPIVDGLATNKIDVTKLLRNTNNVAESTTNLNAIAIATDGSLGFNVLRGSNTTSAVVASYGSYIDGGQNHFLGGTQGCEIQAGASGHGAIVGSDGCIISGGYNNFIGGSYQGGNITGGEENVILSSIGGTQVGGNNNAAIGVQGITIDGSKTVGIACEASTQQAGSYFLFGGGYNLQGQINNLTRQGHFGFESLNVGDGVSGFDVGGSLATSGATVDKQGSTAISVAGESTLYNWTAHLGGIHNFGPHSSKVTDAGNVSGTVDIDGSTGEAFIFTLTGNTQPNFINLRSGQHFIFSVYNDGAHNVTGGTINGIGGNVLAKGGTISPSNNAWSYYTGYFDGSRVYLIEENGLSAI